MAFDPTFFQTIRTLYVQVPFCPERCDYCSIPVSLRPDLANGYVEALFLEKERLLQREDLSRLETMYIGGGTPTVLEPGLFSELLEGLKKELPSLAEITVETRPDVLTEEMLSLLDSKGVTRLSVGMESVTHSQMGFLGRTMDPVDSVRFIEFVRNRFSGRLSMDFIVGGAGYDEKQFLEASRTLLTEGLDHLSVYPLTVEDQTSLKARHLRKELPCDLEEMAGRDWQSAVRKLASQGWHRYEVANFSRSPLTECRHNLRVWQGFDYAGLGAGAHQRIRSVRTVNLPSIRSYELSVRRDVHPVHLNETLTDQEALLEVLYTNARISYGFPLDWMSSGQTGTDMTRFLGEWVACGWIDRLRLEEGRVVFTTAGWDQLDTLMGQLWSVLD
ncbi:MAG: coproporphyrinogen-III oxidase family protein [Leptospirillum sp.]